MKKEMVGDAPGSTLGMLADLMHKLQHGVRTPEELDMFLKGQNPFIMGDDILADWSMFYLDTFGITKDFSGLIIPKKKKGFDRLIIVAEGMTPNVLFDKTKEFTPAWKYRDNLDEIVSGRKADHDYAVWVRERVEADEELKNLSANDLKEKNILGITLEERLLYGLKFFKETRGHLDIKNWTLCSGSRNPGGGGPFVDLFSDEVYVYWYGSDDADDRLRSRAVVS